MPEEELENTPELLPVRMLNEYAYCPRLFHLMHVEGRWADNTYTVEGRNVHQRADKLDHVLPDASSLTSKPEFVAQIPVSVVIVDLGYGEQELHTILECVGKAYEPPARILVI